MRVLSLVSLFLLISAVACAPTTYSYTYNIQTCSAGNTCNTGNQNGLRYQVKDNGAGSLATNYVFADLTMVVGDIISFTSDSGATPTAGDAWANHPLRVCTSTSANQCTDGNAVAGWTSINAASTTQSVMLNTAGTYYYGCTVHPNMGGKITVLDKDSICSFYTRALNFSGNGASTANMKTTLDAVVTRAAKGHVASGTTNDMTNVPGLVTNGAITKKFFDGSQPNVFRPFATATTATALNFTSPAQSAELGTLVNHLTAFFGKALGCYGLGFPSTSGLLSPSMAKIHRAMGINKQEFDYFNTQILLSVTSHAESIGASVRAGDADAVTAFNNRFGFGATDKAVEGLGLGATPGVSQQICNDEATCPKGEGYQGSAAMVQPAVFGFVLTALFAVLLL